MKTRFCPSPTGFMHLGNLRTALFSALLAKSQKGQFLLRIEDTDKERSDVRYTKAILQDFQWLGLDWQEGPGHDQGNGPYFQSQRTEIYTKYYDQLSEAGLVYPCFCSKEKLALARKLQLSSGKPPRYPGTCANLSKEEVQQKIAAGESYTLRFRIPRNKIIEFHDFVQGTHQFNSDDIGDFIVRRTNGTPPFMFCNAIDDALMGVTHVVRGADHVANTANQIIILESLGLPVPQYGHISLIVGYDGAPLAKRHGSSSIKDMRERGFLADAIINYLARLGHYYADNNYMNFNQLAEQFQVEHLSKSPAKFDHLQLMHWQKIVLSQLSEDTLWDWLGEATHSLVPSDLKKLFITTVAPNITFPEDAVFWAQIFFIEIGQLDEEEKLIVQNAGRQFYEVAIQAVAKNNAIYQQVVADLKQNLGLKGKNLFMPLRVALTGETHGPELVNVFMLLGKDELMKRLHDVLTIVSETVC
jgi:glutamyl-tRNA synthetase